MMSDMVEPTDASSAQPDDAERGIGEAEEFVDLAAFERRTGRAEVDYSRADEPRVSGTAGEDFDYTYDDLPDSQDPGAEAGDSSDDSTREWSGERIRLQKVLAQAGVGSRRKSEQMIVEGRVEVDGVVVRELGTRVDPDHAVIRVDGERLNLRADLVYLAFNKPRGVMSTMSDEKGRESIATYVEDRSQRLFHVGRLDADSEGLILLTNDGELAHRLTHPRYGVTKTYLAQVAAPVPRNLGRALMNGIELEDGVAKADSYELLDVSGGRALIQISLHEGRKHIVRRMLAAAGFPVQQLVRTAHGPITLGHLRSGAVRKLNRSELAALYRLVGL